MPRTLLSTLGVLTVATAVMAQPAPPATQPVRPPQRPPQTHTPPRPDPAPDPGHPDPLRPSSTKEAGDPEVIDLQLKGCLQRTDADTYLLAQAQATDAGVTQDVALQGKVEELSTHVGHLVELTGSFEQGTPSTTDPTFAVTKIKMLADTCTPPEK